MTARDPFALDFPRAWRAVRKLIANKEDTAQVFEVMRALTGHSVPKGYARLLQTPEGGRVAYRRVELAAVLDDHAALRRLPAGTVGRAYLAFMEEQDLSAGGLVDESRKVIDGEIDAEHPIAWYARRLRDVHDLWHVLSGYGRDALGEACLVGFSYAQTRALGFAFIALVGGYEIARGAPDQPIRRAIWQAYRNGRDAAWLPGEDYEALLAEPLDAARARLRIVPPSIYLSVPQAMRAEALPTLQEAA